MPRTLTFLTILLLANAAQAQQLSPLQQYLQNEAGYAPPAAQAPAQVPAPAPYPYSMAQSQPVYAATPNDAQETDAHINAGVRGMNF